MVSTEQHRYVLAARDVHEAIAEWLKRKERSVPPYVGNTTTTAWEWGSDTITVSWVEERKD